MDYRKKIIKKMFKLLEQQEIEITQLKDDARFLNEKIIGLSNWRDKLIEENRDIQKSLGNLE